MGIRREITIDGNTYALSSLHERPYRKYAQSPIVGQDKDKYWFTWPMRTWHGGERMRRILTSADIEAGRFHDGLGIDVSEWGELKLQPALTRSLAISSPTLPLCLNSSGTKVLVGYNASPYVKIGSYSAEADTIVWASASSGPAAAPVDFCRAGSSIYAVLSSGALAVTNDDGDTWSAVGTHTGLIGLAYVNNCLYGLKTNQVYNITEDEELAGYGGAFICSFRDSLFWGRNNIVYCYDGNADYEYVQLPDGFTLTAMIPYRMALWLLGYYKVQGGYQAAVHYILPGTENHLYTLGDYSADHRMYACCGGDNEVWFASPKRGGADRFDLEVGGISPGPTWLEPGHIPFKSMATLEGFLLIGRYDNRPSSDGIYVADIASPSQYVPSGWMTTPSFDFGYAYDEKVIRAIRIEHDALTQGQKIKVEYSLDMGNTYELLGYSADVGSVYSEWQLTGAVANSLKIKVTLYAGGDCSTTPVLRAITAQGAPKLPSRWKWEMALAAYKRNRGAADKQDLAASFTSGVPLKFIDRDGSEYTVVIDDIEFQEMQVDKDSAIIIISMRQV